jgi:hypothetical protein
VKHRLPRLLLNRESWDIIILDSTKSNDDAGQERNDVVPDEVNHKWHLTTSTGTPANVITATDIGCHRLPLRERDGKTGFKGV